MPYVKKNKFVSPAHELRTLVESTGIKASKIAEHCGVSSCSISRWLSGGHKIPPLVLEWLRDVDAVVNRKGGAR